MKTIIYIFMIMTLTINICYASDTYFSYDFEESSGNFIDDDGNINFVPYDVTRITGKNGNGAEVETNGHSSLEQESVFTRGDFTEFSMSYWFKPKELIASSLCNERLWIIYAGATNRVSLVFGSCGGTYPLCFYGNYNGNTINYGHTIPKSSYAIDTWYHFTFTFDGTNITVYIDGSKALSEAEVFTPSDMTANPKIYFNSYPANPDDDYNINAVYDDVRIFDIALNDTEAYNIYSYDQLLAPEFYTNFTDYPNDINTQTTLNISFYNTNESVTCYFYVDDVYATGGANTGSIGFIFFDSYWSQGNNSIKSSCTDSVSGNEFNQTINVFVDDINPIITRASWYQESKPSTEITLNQSDIDENFYVNISVSDNNLYSLNLSIYLSGEPETIKYNNFTDNINDISFSIKPFFDLGYFDTSGYYIFKSEVCDSHTLSNIKDIPISKLYDRLITPTFDIISKDSEISSINYQKLDDKYIFSTVYSKEITNLHFTISSKEKINIIKDSSYMGHVVTGKRWIDFTEYNAKNVILTRINDYNVNVEIVMNTAILDTKFNSFGTINCVIQSDNATISSEGNINLLYPSNNTVINVNNIPYNLSVIYIPEFPLYVPDNCTLLVNGVFNFTDYIIETNINNSLDVSFLSPSPQVQDNYTLSVWCENLHRHPPLLEQHISDSLINTFALFNTATTTTTTTTITTPTTTFISGSGSINCQYNPSPYLKIDLPFIDRDLIKWFCDFGDFETKRCYTYVKRKEEIIQTNPGRESIEELGFIDYFEMGRFGSVYFTSVDLVPNFAYNFSVECFGVNSTYNFTAEVIPVDKALEDIVIPRAIYIQNSILALILLVVLIIIGIFVYKVATK